MKLNKILERYGENIYECLKNKTCMFYSLSPIDQKAYCKYGADCKIVDKTLVRVSHAWDCKTVYFNNINKSYSQEEYNKLYKLYKIKKKIFDEKRVDKKVLLDG